MSAEYPWLWTHRKRNWFCYLPKLVCGRARGKSPPQRGRETTPSRAHRQTDRHAHTHTPTFAAAHPSQCQRSTRGTLSEGRCITHRSQSRPDSGVGFQVKVLETSQIAPSSLGRGCCQQVYRPKEALPTLDCPGCKGRGESAESAESVD